MVFQKGQVHENSRRIEPHLASQNLHLCGFQSPPPKKSLEVPRHGLDKFQETLPMFDPIRYMQNIITPIVKTQRLWISAADVPTTPSQPSKISSWRASPASPCLGRLGAKAGSTSLKCSWILSAGPSKDLRVSSPNPPLKLVYEKNTVAVESWTLRIGLMNMDEPTKTWSMRRIYKNISLDMAKPNAINH